MTRRLALESVRGRTTATATTVVGVTLILVGVALVTGTRWRLTQDVRTAAELRAADVVQAVEAATNGPTLAVDDVEDLFIQVLDERDRVVAASANIAGHAPVVSLAAGTSTTIVAPPVDDDRFIVVSAAAVTSDGPVRVHVGRSLEVVTEATEAVVLALVLGLPVVMAVVAATSWRLVGRSLAPVEAIRREVDAITAADLGRRVPEPGTPDEIGRLARTMNRMLERLEAAAVRQRRFVSDASHELRSPIASLRQHAEMARGHPERSSLLELTDVVDAESLRLEHLVEDLLWLARADEQALQANRLRPVDLDDLALEEAARLRVSGVHVETGGVSAGQVEGNPGQLRHLLRNLTDNAATHARTTVAIHVREESDGQVVLAVDDDGPGIPVDERTRVFERFVRLDDARARDTGGSGLGLAIVAAIAEAHGGVAAVTDSPLGGARLEVRFPAPGTFSRGSAPTTYRDGDDL